MAPNHKLMSRTSPLMNKLRSKIQLNRRKSQSMPSLNCGDVLFLVGKQKQPFLIHSCLLSMASDVFRVLFTPSWYSDSDVIEITDVETKAFEVLRQFLYLHLRCGDPTTATTTHRIYKLTDIKLFLSCYYLGHKYNIHSFLSCLENSLSSLINADNVLQMLIYADMYHSFRLRSYCWSFIERNTTKVVKSDCFPLLPWHQFCDILENDRLTIREYELFQGVIRWCRAQPQRMPALGYKIFAIIGVAIYKVRFPLMTRQEFQLVIQSGILKQGEIQDLEHNFYRNKMFISRRRKNVCFCRSNKIPCSLCTICPQFTRRTKSLDGKIIHPFYPPQFNLSMEYFEATENWYRGMLGSCQCAKYASCPAFPNGATGVLMQVVFGNKDSYEAGL